MTPAQVAALRHAWLKDCSSDAERSKLAHAWEVLDLDNRLVAYAQAVATASRQEERDRLSRWIRHDDLCEVVLNPSDNVVCTCGLDAARQEPQA